MQNSIILPNGKWIRYTIENARIIKIDTNCADISENRLDSKLVKITFDESYSICVGDKFENTKYVIGDIVKYDKKSYLIRSHIRNRTTSYIIPTISENSFIQMSYSDNNKNIILITTPDTSKHYFLYDSYLINAYLDKTTRFLFLMYRFSNDDIYKKLELELSKHPNFITCIDQNELVLFKFKIPDKFLPDIDLFLQGKYSMFCEILKKKLVDFHGNKDINPVQVVYKMSNLRHNWEKQLNMKIDEALELDSIPNINHEILII